MKSAFHGNSENVTESILVAKVARLTDDGSTVGPGSYNVAKAFKANSPSAKGANDWSINRTRRQDHFIGRGTGNDVGPGAYHISKYVDRSIQNPTIPRQDKPHTWGAGRKGRAKNNGTIRADYETDSDNEGRERYSPGPGQYISQNHATTFKKTEYAHEHPEKFGSVATRFKEQDAATALGPGQYLSQNVLPKFLTQNRKGGTQNFRSPPRNDLYVSSAMASQPGPSDYAANNSPKKQGPRQAGTGRPFGINTKRFGSDDNGVPGAGKY